MLSQGADPSTPNGCDSDGDPALNCAAYNGHTAIIHALLQASADVNVVNVKGQSVLHHAACRGHTAITHALLQARADVNGVDKGGKTPLGRAKCNGHTEVARLLEAAGGRGKR